MKSVVFGVVLLICSMSAFAQSMNYELMINLNGENGDLDMLIHEAQEESWEVTENEYDEVLITIKGMIDLKKLPFTLHTSGPSVTISRDAKLAGMLKISLSYSIGDDDTSISAETLSTGLQSTYLMISGGDHAGGSWGIDSTLKLEPNK